MNLQPIQRVEGLTKQEFTEQFIRTKTPVILKDFIKGPAVDIWNYDYFKEVAGDLIVPVHGSENAHPDMVHSAPMTKMKFSEYLDLIQREPTESRLFLFNLLIEKPEIRKQLVFNKIADNMLTWLPLMFFGGGGSSTRNHFDIDMSHILHTQFIGRKRVLLFPFEEQHNLYRKPWEVMSFVNFEKYYDPAGSKIDFKAFPALHKAKGYDIILDHGDTLFMPAGYWHHMEYLDSGFAMSLRAMQNSMTGKLKGAWNLFGMRNIDTIMKKTAPGWWYNFKKSRTLDASRR